MNQFLNFIRFVTVINSERRAPSPNTWKVWRGLKKLELLSTIRRLEQLLSFFFAPNFLGRVHLYWSITRYTHAKREPILKFYTICDSHQFGKASSIAQQAVLWNATGRSNRSKLECTDVKSVLKNVVNCRTFKDFNFNVSAPQIINDRCENFIFF